MRGRAGLCSKAHLHMLWPHDVSGPIDALLRKRCILPALMLAMVASELAEPAERHILLPCELLDRALAQAHGLTGPGRKALKRRFLQSIGPVHPSPDFAIARAYHDGIRLASNGERRLREIGRWEPHLSLDTPHLPARHRPG